MSPPGVEADLVVIRSLLDPLVVWQDPIASDVLEAGEEALGCTLPDDLRSLLGVMGGGNVGTLRITPFEKMIDLEVDGLFDEWLQVARWADIGPDEPAAEKLLWIGNTAIELDGPDVGRLHIAPKLFDGPLFYHVAWSLADAIRAVRVLCEQDLLFSYVVPPDWQFTELCVGVDVGRVEEIAERAGCSAHVGKVGFHRRLERWVPSPGKVRRDPNIADDIEAIRSYLGPYAKWWGDPVSADELDAGEEALRVPLPDDLRQLFSVVGRAVNLGSLVVESFSFLLGGFEDENITMKDSRLVAEGSDIGPDEPLTENLFWLDLRRDSAFAVELDGPNAGRLLTSSLGLWEGPFFDHLAWSVGDAIAAIREFCEADLYTSAMVRNQAADITVGATQMRPGVTLDDVADIAARWACSPALITLDTPDGPAPPKPSQP